MFPTLVYQQFAEQCAKSEYIESKRSAKVLFHRGFDGQKQAVLFEFDIGFKVKGVSIFDRSLVRKQVIDFSVCE